MIENRRVRHRAVETVRQLLRMTSKRRIEVDHGVRRRLVHGGRRGHRAATLHQLRLHATTEQVVVEVFAEHAAHAVQRYRVHARVHEAQAEADDAKDVPEFIVVLHRM